MLTVSEWYLLCENKIGRVMVAPPILSVIEIGFYRGHRGLLLFIMYLSLY